MRGAAQPKPFSSAAGAWCWYVDEECLVKDEGYSPRMVFERIAGYLETGGNGTQPYRWGRQPRGGFSLQAAQAHCQRVNAGRGISKERAAEIVRSSMRLQWGRGAAERGEVLQ